MEKNKTLKILRKEIEEIDSELLKNLNNRYNVVFKIQELKTQNNIAFKDCDREKKLLLRLEESYGDRASLAYLSEIYKFILNRSSKPLKKSNS